MLKRFSHFFTCLLLVLMPLQGFAAANMSICNSLMQPSVEQAMQKMPCHEGMTSEANKQVPEKQQDSSKKACKATCAALCASLSVMAALPNNPPTATFLVSAQTVNFPQQVYVSITQPNLQRPPIFFI